VALLDSPSAPARLAAGAVAYNLALALPRSSDATARLAAGLARRALPPPAGAATPPPPLDGEAGLRVLLAIGRAVHGSRAAGRQLRALAPDPAALAGGAGAGDPRAAVVEDLRKLIAAVPS
jgi:hypothetical protein